MGKLSLNNELEMKEKNGIAGFRLRIRKLSESKRIRERKINFFA